MVGTSLATLQHRLCDHRIGQKVPLPNGHGSDSEPGDCARAQYIYFARSESSTHPLQKRLQMIFIALRGKIMP